MGLKKLRGKIAYIAVGEGFKSPAVAIYKHLKKRGIDVSLSDVAKDHGSHFIDRLYKKGWALSLRHPLLFEAAYKLMDSRKRLLENMLFLRLKRNMERSLLEEKPDFILSTHFSSTFHYGGIIKKKKLGIPLFAYNSDAVAAHSYWVCNDLESYFVPTKKGLVEMVKKGQNPNLLELSGFPIDEKFNKKFSSVKEERKKLGLKDAFTALLMMGGEGIGPVRKVVGAIFRAKPDVQLVAICGKNEGVKKSLEDLNCPSLAARGFVENMQDYLYCSDIVLGKSGLNFVFESLYFKKPFITVKAMANEKHMASYLVENKVGWWPKSQKALEQLLKKIFFDKEYLKRYASRIKKLAHAYDTGQIADSIIKRAWRTKRIALRNKKVLLFDLVGTLCDIPISEKNWHKINYEGIECALKFLKINRHVPKGEFKRLCSEFVLKKAGLRKNAKNSLKEYELKKQISSFLLNAIKKDNKLEKIYSDISAADIIRLEEEYIKSELRIASLFKDAIPLLEVLSKKYDLCLICNNASDLLVERILQKFHIKKYFKRVLTSAMIGVRKPHFKFFENVLNNIGCRPESCVIIGDRLNQDIKMANISGVTSIHVAITGHEDNKGADEESDFQVKSLKGLMELFQKD